MKNFKILSISTLLILGCIVSQLQAQTLFSVSQDDILLRKINTNTGATMSSTSLIYAGAAINGMNGLTFDNSGQMWGLARISGMSSNRALVKIDTLSGVVTLVGFTGDGFAGIAFNAAGTLYGVSGDGASTPESLFTLNTSTGAPTFACTLGNGSDGETIGYNPIDGLIYHASGHSGSNVIFETVSSTCVITNIDITGGDLQDEEAQALCWWPAQGAFFWKQDHRTGPLFKVETDGTATLIGAMDHQSKGLAMLPANVVAAADIPTVSEWGLILFGLLVLSLAAGLLYRKRVIQTT